MSEKEIYSQEDILNDFKDNIEINVIEKQLEYYWIRLYTSEEYDIEPGTIIEMNHKPSNETIELMFTNYDKKGKTNIQSVDIEEFVKEDDKKVLCLLVNMSELYTSDRLDFIRTLFRKSRFYEERLIKRKDLVFSTDFKHFTDDSKVEKESTNIDYYDTLF